MRRTLLVCLAAATFACGGSDRNDAAIPAQSTAPAPGSDPLAQKAPEAEQTIALVGCLRGPGSAGATGTTGTSPETAPPAPSATESTTKGERFTLVGAKPDGQAGVGANGAGGSGGPVVSGTADYELDDIPNGARPAVNKQVRITGLIDARPVGDAPDMKASAPTGLRRVEVQSVEVIGSCPE